MSKSWTRVALCEIATDIKDGTHGTHPRVEEGIPLLSAKNISDGGKVIVSDHEELISPHEYQLITSSFAPQSGDLLITIVGTVGRRAIFDGSKMAFQRSVAFVRPRKTILAEYLYHAVGSDEFVRQLAQRSNATAQTGLYLGELAKVTVPLPPRSTQRRIAEILSTVDEAIEQTEALIVKYQQIKAGLLQDLFTRGVTPDGHLRPTRAQAPHLYKDSPLGWIPKEWEVQRLDSVSAVDRGKFTIRPRNDPQFYGGQYPFIQTGDVALSEGRTLNSYSQTLNEMGLSVSRLFPAGTIMVTIAANIADTCIIGIPMCAPDSLVGVQPKARENARFIELSIRRRKMWLETRAPQTAQRNINLEDLRPLLIAWPDGLERLRISERYEAHDAAIATCETHVRKLRQQKQGLMHDLLTGRVRVKVDEPVGGTV